MRSASVWRRSAVALALGLLLASVFPPFDLPWPLLIVAVAGWFSATSGLGAAAAGTVSFAFGLGLHLLLLRWMLVVGVDAWLALAVLEALFMIPIGWVRSSTARPGRSILLIAATWPAMDFIRDHAGPVAFGWGQLAFASVEAPWAALAPLGQWLVTASLVALGGALALTWSATPAVRVTAAGATVLGLTLPLLASAPVASPGTGARIALVQAGVEHTGLGFIGDRREVMRRNLQFTRDEITPGRFDLVIWPENAVDVDPYTDPEASASMPSVARSIGTPILFGALLEDDTHRRNVSAFTDGSGVITSYTKQRLVPFGEYLPARDLIARFTDRHLLIPKDFAPGAGPGSLSIGGGSLAIVICFEVADEGIVRSALRGGASALLVQTNNATYAGLGQSEQQLRIAQFRARSLGVSVYVVSTNGPTAVIDRAGRVTQRIAEGDTGYLATRLPAVRVQP